MLFNYRSGIWGARGPNGEGTSSTTGEEHDVRSHMFRPNITDMHDKYGDDRSDIYRISSRYTKVAVVGRLLHYLQLFTTIDVCYDDERLPVVCI